MNYFFFVKTISQFLDDLQKMECSAFSLIFFRQTWNILHKNVSGKHEISKLLNLNSTTILREILSFEPVKELLTF